MNPESKGFRAQAARVHGSAPYLRLALDLLPHFDIRLSADAVEERINEVTRERTEVRGAGLVWGQDNARVLSTTVAGISPALTALIDQGRELMARRWDAGSLVNGHRDPARYPAVGDRWRSGVRKITLEVVAIEWVGARARVRCRTQDGRDIDRDLDTWASVTQAYGTLDQRGGV